MGEAPDAVSAELICQPILLPNFCFGTSRIRGQTQTRDREIINPIANAFLVPARPRRRLHQRAVGGLRL